MMALIQSAQAYVPKLVAMTLAVDWPVNWARLAIPLENNLNIIRSLVDTTERLAIKVKTNAGSIKSKRKKKTNQIAPIENANPPPLAK